MDKNIRSWRSLDRQSERDSREYQLELNLLFWFCHIYVLNILLRATQKSLSQRVAGGGQCRDSTLTLANLNHFAIVHHCPM